jgi:hypothetical protein
MRISTACIAALVVVGAACRNNENGGEYSPFEIDLSDQITVRLTGSGVGSGSVKSRDQVVGIGCRVQSGTTANGTAKCDHTFSDFGGGGTFVLDAVPDAGSVFAVWTGCSSATGASCTLSFPAGVRTRVFLVSARFERAP